MQHPRGGAGMPEVQRVCGLLWGTVSRRTYFYVQHLCLRGAQCGNEAAFACAALSDLWGAFPLHHCLHQPLAEWTVSDAHHQQRSTDKIKFSSFEINRSPNEMWRGCK
jgi:hypothetical protein